MMASPITLLTAFINIQKWRPSPVRKRRQERRMIHLLPFETGGCEGCAMEVMALKDGAVALEASGFCCVTQPQEADWLLVTGPVTRHAAITLQDVWEAMPEEGRSLIAVGDCAINGGPFPANYATLGGLEHLSRVYQVIPGCPPSPDAVLNALVDVAGGSSSSSMASASLRSCQ